ncbi:This enzyme is probably necessary for target cell lysis in cell-mediated immune responses [Seminavis robusta]|uniref:This enzyme is probably necessary for target cell lysis in cell-mediated immune responses n=1 Tax=Seminavis robusta TaxID=568900 RepID=A0A9N8H815_9STRA|nr:This enzyme is probably necessary for target cell lysis in cell-mediated immune responses [Seminavis robusta]|eukprot:Sro201_g085010.1 This enzyme is probably necessary for target cell lysis in cell-mediated immune responses (309) ;mRNA; r:28378-29673
MLSAAHCNGRDESLGDPFSRRVYLGGRRRGTGVARNMAKRIPHPRWDDSLRSNIEWDFLVVKLNQTTKGVEGLIPIPLNDQNDYPVGGETLTAIGYGRLTSGGRELPDMLRHVEIAAFSNERCGTYYGDTGVTFQQESMLCAGVDGGGRGLVKVTAVALSLIKMESSSVSQAGEKVAVPTCIPVCMLELWRATARASRTVNNPVIVKFNVTNGRNGTYHFTIADSARDGICCEHGQGNVTIFNTDTGDVLFFNDNVTEKFQFWFTVDNVGTVLSTRIKEGADVEDEDNDMGEGVGIGGDKIWARCWGD